VVEFDEFAVKLSKRKPPPFAGGKVGEWSDTDDTRTAMMLQRQYGFTPGSLLVREALCVLAEDHRFNPVTDWLRSLKWDGVPRLDHWAIDYLNTGDTPYVRLASRWWLMGAVARALKPGCKFDYVLVLEGRQGKRKSMMLEILGGAWFGDQELDFSNKDSMMALQGKLIYEIPELGALARSDERRQKAFITRRVDEFRPPFGRGFIKQPRQMIFAGTTNEWEWNKDPTGGRRFWPLPCDGELNPEGLSSVRDQLFAEAMVQVLAGERYWPTEEEQRTLFDPEQLKIEQPDAILDAIHDWVFGRTAMFSLAEAAFDGLKLDASKLTRDMQTRIGQALRKMGCTKHEKSNGVIRFWYKPPPSEEARSKTGTPAQPEWEGDDVPL
jgi:putative DNA primase/helicase